MTSYRWRFLAYGCTHPRAALLFLRESHRLRAGDRGKNAKVLALRKSSQPAIQILTDLIGGGEADRYVEEATRLYDEAASRVSKAYGYSGTGRKPSIIDLGDAVIIYSLVRQRRPLTVVETGVSDGMSSLLILEAMRENAVGTLYSIDLPEVGMPALYGLSPGWLVKEELRSRWHLILEDTAVALPRLLVAVDNVEIFLHDSEHSYEAMLREFTQVLAAFPQIDYVLSDDSDGNDALIDAADLHPSQFRTHLTLDGFGILSRQEVSNLEVD
jgi:Methyltransferase domain